jgi:hypothetical protein
MQYWRQQKDALLSTNKSRKAFQGQKSGKFSDLKVNYGMYMRNDGVGVSQECYISDHRRQQNTKASLIQNLK